MLSPRCNKTPSLPLALSMSPALRETKLQLGSGKLERDWSWSWNISSDQIGLWTGVRHQNRHPRSSWRWILLMSLFRPLGDGSLITGSDFKKIGSRSKHIGQNTAVAEDESSRTVVFCDVNEARPEVRSRYCKDSAVTLLTGPFCHSEWLHTSRRTWRIPGSNAKQTNKNKYDITDLLRIVTLSHLLFWPAILHNWPQCLPFGCLHEMAVSYNLLLTSVIRNSLSSRLGPVWPLTIPRHAICAYVYT